MSRYIDADKLKKDMSHQYLTKGYFYVSTALECIDDAPTADVVEITKCKDCKFYKPYDKPCEDFDGWCLARNCETDEYDFCNYGVMRKDTTSDAEIH